MLLSTYSFVEIHHLPFVSDIFDEFEHIGGTYNQRSMIVVGMETNFFDIHETFVNKQSNLMVFVVYKTEKADRPRTETKVFHHPLGRCKRKFTLSEHFFDRMDIHLMPAIHYNKVVPISFVISEEEIFTKSCILASVELCCNLNSWSFRMFVVFIFDAHLVEAFVHLWLSYHLKTILSIPNPATYQAFSRWDVQHAL